MANKPNDNPSSKPGSNRPKSTVPPAQAQLSPQEIRRREQERLQALRQRLFLRKVKRVCMGIFLIALVGGLYYLLIESGKGKPKGRLEDREANAPTDLETAVKGENVTELMRMAAEKNNNFVNLPLPTQIQNLKEKYEICKRLENLNADETSRLFGISGQLDSLIMLDTLNSLHSLNDAEARSDLAALAKRARTIDDERIQQKANLGMCLAATHDYCNDPTDGKFQSLLDQIDSSRALFMNDFTAANSLFRLGQLVEVAGKAEHVRQYKGFYGNLFKESDNEEVSALGAFAHDSMLLGEFDFERISEDVFLTESEGLQELSAAISKVVANPKISSVPLSKLLSLTENLSQVNQSELEQKLVDDLKKVMNAQTREIVIERMQAVFDRYETRKALVAKEIALSGTTYDDKPIQEISDNKVVVLAFFSVRNETSMSYLESINLLRFDSGDNVLLLAACVETNMNQSMCNEFQRRFPRLELTKPESAPELMTICPVAKVPYVLIIDQTGRVVSLNVHMGSIREQVQRVLGGENPY